MPEATYHVVRPVHGIRPLLVCLQVALLVAVSTARLLGGDSAGDRLPSEEIPILIRISQAVVEDLTRDEVTLSLPIRRSIDGIPVRGEAEGTGRTAIQLVTTNGLAEFTVEVRGTATANFHADAGLVSSAASTSATFVSRKRIRFDGTRFEQYPAETTSHNLTSIDRICSKHGGCLGRLVRHVAWGVVRKEKRKVNRTVQEVTEEMITSAFDREAEALIDKLDQTVELEETVVKYFPINESWIYHLATRDDYLLAGAGPRNAVFPQLPAGSEDQLSAPIEIWLRTTPLQAALIETLLVDWNVAHDALKEVLPKQDARSVSEDVVVLRREGWSVIQVGAHANP